MNTNAQNNGAGFQPSVIHPAMNLGRWPRLVWAGPLALADAGGLALNRSANGASPYQPGATPQVSTRKHPKG